MFIYYVEILGQTRALIKINMVVAVGFENKGSKA